MTHEEARRIVERAIEKPYESPHPHLALALTIVLAHSGVLGPCDAGADDSFQKQVERGEIDLG